MAAARQLWLVFAVLRTNNGVTTGVHLVWTPNRILQRFETTPKHSKLSWGPESKLIQATEDGPTLYFLDGVMSSYISQHPQADRIADCLTNTYSSYLRALFYIATSLFIFRCLR